MAISRYVKKARAEYDGYLLVKDEYIRESFRIIFENYKDLAAQVQQIEDELVNLEVRITTNEKTLSTHSH
tara:strand:- start:78 stop:287 length:210 start_codon:yes stop_codon:yes gene_type:complete